MSRKTPKRRRWRLVLFWGALLGGTVLLSAPLWLPWAAGSALRAIGVQVGSVNRTGWLGLRFAQLVYQFPGGEVRVDKCAVEDAGQLVGFLVRPAKVRKSALLTAQNWVLTLETGPDETGDPAEPPSSVGAILDQVAEVLQIAGRWVPPATLLDGQVQVGGVQLNVGKVHWLAKTLEIDVAFEGRPIRGLVRLDAAERAGWRLEVVGGTPQVELEVDAAREDESWKIAAKGTVEGCAWEVDAELPISATRPWPTSVRVRVPDLLAYAGGLTAVPGLRQLRAQIQGAGDETGLNFELLADGSHTSVALSNLQVRASGRLSQDGMEIRTLSLQAPLLSLDLESPTSCKWAQRFTELEAQWRIRSNLAAQQWLPLAGEVGGTLDVAMDEGHDPAITLALASTNCAAWGRKFERLVLEAQSRGSIVDQGEVSLRATDGSALSIRLSGLDIAGQTLKEVVARADLTPALVRSATGITLGSATAEVQGSGNWGALNHSGAAHLKGVQLAGLRDSSLELDWKGMGLGQAGVKAHWATEEGWVELEAEVDDLKRARVSTLTVGGIGAEALTLAQPAELLWGSAVIEDPAVESQGSSVSLSTLELTNSLQMLVVDANIAWPRRGSFSLKLQQADPKWVTAFAPMALPAVRLEDFEANVNWKDGPLIYDLRAAGSLKDPNLGELRTVLDVAGDGQALRVKRLELLEADQSWARVQGDLPVVLRMPGSGPSVEVLGQRAMRLTAAAEPNPTFERWLRNQWQIRLVQARSQIELTGTPFAPSGQINVQIDSIEPITEDAAADVRPALKSVELRIDLQPERVRLESMRLQVVDHTLTGDAELPLPDGTWEALLAGEWRVNASQLHGRLTVSDFPVGSVGARWLGPMRPEGLLNGEVRLQPGWRLEGELGLDGLSTRAFPLLGPIRDIQGRIAFQGQQATITGMEADWGGANVQLSGLVDTAICWRQPGAFPTFDVRVSAGNLPLARQAGLIVRSDLDLHFLRNEGEPPLIQGEIELQRSFVLSDLDAVLGTAVRQTSLPPPYFSVTQEPMASWRLDLALRGDRCVHVKSPFYRGIHSVNARLAGTLRDPLLTGDVQINEGRALFPYASIPIRQGILTFTEQDPEEPRLVVLGASRTFGYDLRMDVSGSLNEPMIQFSSVPSLTSEEIVMMITAGELPRNELTTTTEDRVAKLATLIGKDILNKLGSQDAGEERLILRTGEGISTGGRVTYNLEYRLTDSWGLVGEYDEYDAINAGVKWRIIQR